MPGKFSPIGEKANVLTIKTHFSVMLDAIIFNHEWTQIDTNGEELNAEARRAGSCAEGKRASHEFHA